MIKFNDYKYVRPNIDEVKSNIRQLLGEFELATSFEEENELLKKINKIRSEVDTMSNLVYIRHTVNTNDEFYENEQNYLDEVMPLYEEVVSEVYKVLIKSKFKSELEEVWGKQLFRLAEMALKSFSPEIIEELQHENRLVSQYTKLMASAKIIFEGEERNLSQLGPFMQSKDREMRKRAYDASNGFYEENEKKIDTIFDELVKVRTKMAKKLGYNNFVELAYLRLNRSDYNAEMAANYRKQILDHVVPVACKLKERQARRLNLGNLKYYDNSLEFLSGNATPKGDPEWIIKNGMKMYDELSAETSEFFRYMVDGELMDLVSKKGKRGGGYCTFITEYKSPYIFSNFNGTSGDVDVLTHEAGHAFQAYCSRDLGVVEYSFPTYEASEIHSTAMEFLAWPWMKLFFEEDVDKYKFTHLSGAMTFMPYGVTVDEFQHFVYEKPDATPEERKSMWREIEKKYLPYKDYEECEFLNKGTWWYRQNHIFATPFYYIDYTLAQVCALEFWVKAGKDRENTWSDYLRLCKAGGSKSFLELVELANLKNPFENGCIENIVPTIEEWLSNVDDSVM